MLTSLLIAALDQGEEYSFDKKIQSQPFAGSVELVDIYDLAGLDLERYCGIVIPSTADQEFLLKHRQIIRDYLDSRRVVVFCGHLFRPWLPGASNFVPKKIGSYKDYAVKVVPKQHPIFAGVLDHDITFRKGVAGFFARGHHVSPPGAEVLVAFEDGTPVTYIDRKTTKGTILLHSGNDLLGYYGEGEKTAGRIAGQLVKWILEEYKRERKHTREGRRGGGGLLNEW